MKKYSLIILGGGVAGYTAAFRAVQNGMSVALFERDQVGGTCLNRGCIPTKTLLHSSEIYSERTCWPEMGIIAENVSLNENAIYSRKDAIIQKLRNGILSLLKANKIDFFSCQASFLDEHSVTAEGEVYTAEKILIATGSSPIQLNIPGIELTVNSDRVLEKPLPGQNLIIIGGGVIGVEFASYFADTGRKVTIIEAQERILPMMEKELSLQLAALLRKKGILLKTSASVESFTKRNTENETETLCANIRSGDKTESLCADQIIISVGRKANLDGLNLEKIGVQTKRGILVDQNMYTGVAGIYAAGDVISHIQLAHYAGATATVAVESMMGLPHSVDLKTVPSCVYTSPEIACVGISEAECLAQNIEVEIGKYQMGGNGKSMISGADRGYIKTIIEKNTGKILGASAFCLRATDIIGELALAISQNMRREQITQVIHAHPTIMEGILESLEASHGRCIYQAPQKK
ncbi:MAG: dihydrolipoyl dehydrogenase [Planctomycetia bacterium]|nr:dihydrolipoyl dehydrogenase [Planctomycetia bacterium]